MVLNKAFKSQLLCGAYNRIIFKSGNTAVKLAILAIHRKIWGILTHKTQKYILYGQYTRKSFKSGNTVLSARWQHKVTHYHSPRQHSTLGEPTRAHLAIHLHKSALCNLGIIGRKGIRSGSLGRAIFKIGKIYIHKTVKHSERLDVLISRSIVHHGNTQLPLYKLKRERNIVGKVRRSDEIYILRSLIAKSQKLGGKLVRRILSALLTVAADISVLTVNATKRATAKEHRTRPVFTADRRFFIGVQSNSRHSHLA